MHHKNIMDDDGEGDSNQWSKRNIFRVRKCNATHTLERMKTGTPTPIILLSTLPKAAKQKRHARQAR